MDFSQWLSPEYLLFYVCGAICVVTASMLLISRNTVYCVLALVTNFCSLALVYYALSAPLVAAIQVIVYAGAIMVLFLFVIMFLDLKSLAGEEKTAHSAFRRLAVILGMALFVELILIIVPGFLESSSGVVNPTAEALSKANYGQIAAFSKEMFVDYMWPFELVGVLLMVALLGVVVLARRGEDK
jgi:NADH-quinone oxidoreductase subunit J